jgi:hypothetical protein
MAQLSVTGGMRAGWNYLSWPFARLTVSEAGLCLSGFMSGTYSFVPGEVVSLERVSMIPFLSSAIQIVHNRSDYPPKIVFWVQGSTARLLARIRETGFEATAPISSAIRVSGFPLQWWVVVVVVIVWNGLLFIDTYGGVGESRKPGAGVFVALALVFLFAWALRSSDWLQERVLREGHTVNEFKPALLLALAISGLGMIAILLSFWTGY